MREDSFNYEYSSNGSYDEDDDDEDDEESEDSSDDDDNISEKSDIAYI